MAKVTLTSKSNAMKSYLPLFLFAVLLSSCSSVYKSGQTPDDVYYSPERPREEYVNIEKRDDRRYRDRYEDVSMEDQYLRMKVRNRRYVFLDTEYDSYYYGSNYNRYNDYYRSNSYGYGTCWGSGNGGYSKYNVNPYYYNPYYSNPYYSGVVYGNVSPVYNKPRTSNLNVYGGNSNPNYNSNSKVRVYSTNSSDENANYRNSNTNAGGFLRNVFGSGNNTSSSTSSTPAPASNNNNASAPASSSSSHAPVRKF